MDWRRFGRSLELGTESKRSVPKCDFYVIIQPRHSHHITENYHTRHHTLQSAQDLEIISRMSDANCYVSLTHDKLNVVEIMDQVRSPKAGAIVLFAGG